MKVRAKCIYGEEWHYIYEEQEELNQNIECPEHSASVIEDFVVVIPDIL